MKKLMLLLAIVLMSCDNKDELPEPVQQGSVRIVSVYFNNVSPNTYNFTAVLNNETSIQQNGVVQISLDNGNSTVYVYIENVSINANSSVEVGQVSDILFYSEPEIISYEFIK